MSPRLRATLQTTAALTVAAVVYVLVTLPPRAKHLTVAPPPNVVYGAYHVHTTHSDGSGTPEAVAHAAAQAGLQFVLLTDHGDATRRPDPPVYRDGVLIIDGVEISTAAGHLVALGLTDAAPYPLRGQPDDVIEDVHRLGGWAVIAHPDSPKPELRWTSGVSSADGIEWLNVDSEWRGHAWSTLANTLLHALVRPPESISTLMTRPAVTLQRWDRAASTRTVVALAGADAHGWPESGGRFLPHPNLYTAVFRTIAQSVVLDAPLSGSPIADARAILHAVESGRTFSIITAFARPGSIDVIADDGASTARMGERLAAPRGPISISARVPEAPDALLTVFHNGRVIGSQQGSVRLVVPPASGSYRVEASLSAGLPWIVSNPVYIGPEVSPPPEAVLRPSVTQLPISTADAHLWAIEHAPRSTALTTVDGTARVLQFHLGDVGPDQFVALVHDMAGNAVAFDRAEFVVWAEHPMRLSVQFRLSGIGAERWARSIYIDSTPRTVVVPLRDLRPVGFAATRRPIAVHIQAVLFVVDPENAAPGTSGRVWISNLVLGNAGLPSAPSGPDGKEQIPGAGDEQ